MRLHTERHRLFLLLVAVATVLPVAAQETKRKIPEIGSPEFHRNFWRLISPPPSRRDTPLREQNIHADEVDEITALVKEKFPGAIVYISAVVEGCPCEDGPACTDQVWTEAVKGERSFGLALSRIDDKWQVGPLQEWWLTRGSIQSLRDKDGKLLSYRERWARERVHREAYPFCAEDTIDDITVSYVGISQRSWTL